MKFALKGEKEVAGKEFEYSFNINGIVGSGLLSSFQQTRAEMQISEKRINMLQGKLDELDKGYTDNSAAVAEYNQKNQQLQSKIADNIALQENLQQSIEESKSKITSYKNSLNLLKDAYQNGNIEVSEYKNQQRSLTAAINQERTAQAGLKNYLAAAKNETKSLKTESSNLKKEYATSITAVKKYENQHHSLTEALENEKSAYEGLAASSTLAGSANEMMKSRLSGMLSAGAGIGFLGGAAAKVGGSIDILQQALSNFQTATGASNEELQKFQQTLLNVYASGAGQDYEDIASAMKLIYQQTKLTGQELENASKGALLVRDAFDIDVNESVRAASSLMKNFGINAEQAYNLIAVGARNGANKNGDLADTLNEYAVQFKQLGFSAEQFTEILIKGADQGAFSVDKVGDAIKEFNIRVKDGSKTTAEGFGAIGLNADVMASKFAAGGISAQKAFTETIAALSKVENPVARNIAGVNLFGTMWEDLGEKGVLALAKLNNSVDMNNQVINQMQIDKITSFGQALDFIGRQAEVSVVGPLGQKTLPIMKDLATWMVNNSDTIQNVAVPALLGLGAAATALSVGALLPLIATIGWIPVAIGGVTAAGVALYNNWENLTNYASEAWGSAANTVDEFGNQIETKFDSITGWITTKWNDVKSFLSNPITATINYVKNGSGGVEVAANAAGGIYGKGAFLTTFAENSGESAIPHTPTARNIGLLAETNKIMGNPLGVGSNIQINAPFSPQITISGTAENEQLMSILQAAKEDFIADIKRILDDQDNQQRRLSFQ